MRRILAIVAVLVLLPLTVSAQVIVRPCLKMSAWIDSLEREWGEYPIAIGIVGPTARMTVFVSPTSQTWTLVITDQNGCGHEAGSGKSWTWLELPDPPVPTEKLNYRGD